MCSLAGSPGARRTQMLDVGRRAMGRCWHASVSRQTFEKFDLLLRRVHVTATRDACIDPQLSTWRILHLIARTKRACSPLAVVCCSTANIEGQLLSCWEGGANGFFDGVPGDARLGQF